MNAGAPAPSPPWRERLHEIIFEADTTAGKLFDIGLMVAIGLSIAAVVLETVPGVSGSTLRLLRIAEWGFTVLFTAEYALRLATVNSPRRYATSFFGIVDLLAVLPTYLAILLPGAQAFLTIRALRLLRMFRVFKLARYLGEADVLTTALKNSRRKISIFLFTVLILVLIIGSAMYVVEGPDHGFVSIPHSVYWAIVTVTTVGYGDITPHTAVGRVIASLLMVIGYGIIAVPTGIVSVELADAVRKGPPTAQACPACGRTGHDRDAAFCKFCGSPL